MDGTLIDSESRWEEVRRDLVLRAGGHWLPDAQRRMMGLSSREWPAFMRRELGVRLSDDEIAAEVRAGLANSYKADLPLIPGAVSAVRRLARRWPIAIASSSDLELIELVMTAAGLGSPVISAIASAEEVEHGKPAPDVYLLAAARLGQPPEKAVAVEDSETGVRAALAAGMGIVLIPNRQFPPAKQLSRSADVTLDDFQSLDEPAILEAAQLAKSRQFDKAARRTPA